MLDNGCLGTGAVYISGADVVSHAYVHIDPVFKLGIYAVNISTVCDERSRHFGKPSERSFDTVKDIGDYSRCQSCRHGRTCCFNRLAGLESRRSLIDLDSRKVGLDSDDLAYEPFVSDIDHFLHRKGPGISHLYNGSVYRIDYIHISGSP